MKNNLIIIGSGSFALEILNYFCEIFKPKKTKKIYFLGTTNNKNNFYKIHENSFFVKKIPTKLNKVNTNFIIAYGNEILRSKYFKKYVKNFTPIKLVHPTAYIASSVNIEEGAIICPQTVLSIGSKIMKNALINTGSQIGHHTVIGESSIISTGAIINGRVIIGSRCFVGSNSTVMQNIKFQNSSKVTANSALYSNLKSKHIAHGNPAKQRKLILN
jgi:UDP-N-acetylbacillosamine N-acetyltransferase